MRNGYFHLKNLLSSRTEVRWFTFVLVFVNLFLLSCTPTNQNLTDLTGGETVNTKNNTINGPLGNSALVFSPSLKDFGTLATNSGTSSQVFTVTNSSSSTVYLGTITGATVHFSVASGTCTNGSILVPNGTCTFTATFAPLVSGVLGTSVSIPYDVTSGTNTFYSSVSLTGAGTTLSGFNGLDSISSIGVTSVQLNWTDVVGADSYQVYRVTTGSAILVSSQPAASVCVAGSCAYTVTGLSPSTNYGFRVRATDANTIQEQNIVNRYANTLDGNLTLSTANWTSTSGRCTTFTVYTRNSAMALVNMTTDTAITIGGLGTGGAIYSNAGCTTSASTVTVLSGASSQSFYYLKTTGGAITMTATLTTYGSGSLSHTVLPGILSLTGNSSSVAGTTCTAITLSTLDASSAAINMLTDAAVTMSGLGNGAIYSDVGCTTTYTTPIVSSGTNSKTFYYKNTTAEAITLSANLSLYATASGNLAHTVTHNTADHFVYVSGNNQTALPNTKTASPLVIKLTDRWGNAVSNAAIGFMIEQGNGIPEPQYTTTDSSGNAQTYFRVGSKDRTNKLVARRVGSLLPDAAGTGNTQYTLTATTSTAAISVFNYVIPSTTPVNMATGDIDADGDQDFVVGNYTSNTMSVYKNLGGGAFTAATTYAGAGGNSCFDVKLYDIDKDSDLDMLCANNGTTISYWVNNGSGVFGARNDRTATAGTLGMTLADFNNDTWPDIAVTSNTNARVEIYLNNGAGAYTTTSAAITAGTNPRTIVTDDFNGDGNKDLAWTNLSDDTVSISTGNGNGTFNARTNYTVGDGPFYLISKDINGDSQKDLIINNNTAGTTSVLLGVGNATFTGPNTYPACTTVREIAVEDFDADGDQDVASSCWGENKIVVMNGNGTGALAAPTAYTAMSSTTMPIGIAAADFDGDGRKDLASSFYTNGNYVAIIYNKGTSFTPFPKNPSDSGTSTITPVVADFDGDDVIDIAITDQTNNAVRIYLGNGNGTFQTGSAYTGISPTGIQLGDIDRDGYLDLVTTSYMSGGTGQAINIFTGAAAGVFNAATTLTTCAGPYGIVLKDFNRDAHLDMATSCYGNNTTNYLRVHLNNGNGTYANGVDYTMLSTGPLDISVADLTGDGILDLIAPNYTALTGTRISYFPGVGNGTFGARQDYTAAAGVPAPINITTGDMDNDGDLDIIVSNYNTDNISILFNNAGDFSTRTTYPTLQNPRGISAADLNGDGNLDLVINSQVDLATMIFYGTGSGALGTRKDYYNPDAIYFNTTADFNSDGKLEILSSTAANKGFLLMQSK